MTGVLSSVSPITQQRIENFRANRRGWWSLWIFLVLFVVSLFAEFVANDKPLLVRYNDSFYMPVLTAYPETEFGGDFLTEADYSSPYVAQITGNCLMTNCCHHWNARYCCPMWNRSSVR